MRDVLRWTVRQPRVWLALAACVTATLLAGRDGRTGWTWFVALMTSLLAGLAVRTLWSAEHPGRAEAKRQQEVDAILWRYERERRARERAAGGSDDVA